jgi:hypothetical protein
MAGIKRSRHDYVFEYDLPNSYGLYGFGWQLAPRAFFDSQTQRRRRDRETATHHPMKQPKERDLEWAIWNKGERIHSIPAKTKAEREGEQADARPLKPEDYILA